MPEARTIAISGSASGIGAATRGRLTEDGHRVIGIDRHDADVVVDLGTSGGRAQAVAEVRRLAGGRLDGLALCAGVGARSPQPEIISINYFGVVSLLEGLREDLARGREPAAVVVASAHIVFGQMSQAAVDRCLAGDEAGARQAVTGTERTGYGSAKLALAQYVRRTAVSPEWVGCGITLNAVAPGVVRTPMTADRIDLPDTTFSVPKTMGRYAEAWELAAVLDFFLGPGSRFITGQVLFVDGGAEAARHSAYIGARSSLGN